MVGNSVYNLFLWYSCGDIAIEATACMVFWSWMIYFAATRIPDLRDIGYVKSKAVFNQCHAPRQSLFQYLEYITTG